MEQNKKRASRKIITAILIPVLLFIGACAIAAQVGHTGPFDISDTWLIWIIYCLMVAYWEDVLFFRINAQAGQDINR